ncbi:late histone H2B.L4-like [Dendrobium catenatum]|uniref:Histone H2B.2 n=1 Tax=Dendrobium catenatum TaxID=906689 RepID=A0A2I0W5C5_9ASPA|nr:late histone H2B.L4-like [Dendrobium catenatum]PKU70864.1 Histone H2B.2 [Dendrobium catenatum]
MAPKRSKKVVGTVVKTTRKLVKETVEVDVDIVDGEEQQKVPEIVVVEKGDVGVPVVVVLPTVKTSKEQEKKTEDREETKEDKTEEKKRKKRKKKRGINVGVASSGYKRYVFRVLKQVHPGMRVSAQAMSVLEGMMRDMFERIAEEAAQLNKYTGKVTLSSKEIQDAVRLIMPGELGKHAIAEGVKAVTTYMEK